MKLRVLAAIALLAWIVPQSLHAQAERARFERQLERIRRETRELVNPNLGAEQRVYVDYGGSVAFNFLSVDDTEGKNHTLRESVLAAYLRADLDGVHRFFIRAETSYEDWNAGDSFDHQGDRYEEPTLERATYSFDLQRMMQAYEGENIDWNVQAHVGRQLVAWGNGLVLVQEIDGGRFVIETQPVTVEILAGLSRNDTADIDSSRPGFRDDTKRGFFGAMVQSNIWPMHRPYVYGLVQQDYNDQTSRRGLTRTKFDYNSYYVGGGVDGLISDRLRYGVEMAYEGGTSLSSSFDEFGPFVRQTEEDIVAFGADFQIDYHLPGANRTRFSAEMIVTTGDIDRGTTSDTFGGNRRGTEDHAFNAFGLLNTGLAFGANPSNLIVGRLGASTRPLPNHQWLQGMQIGADVFAFSKFNAKAPIDEPTEDRAFLGMEADAFVNWQVVSDVHVSLRYAAFFPGEAIPEKDVRHFLFTGVLLAF